MRTPGKKMQSGSETISCICRFTLNYTFPKNGKAVEISHKWDHNLSLASAKHVVSNSFCQSYSSTPPIAKAHFMVTEGRACLRISAKLFLILPLNIYHSTANVPLHPMASLSKAWFMARSPSASSDLRRVHHGDFSLAALFVYTKSQAARGRWMDGKRESGLESEDELRGLVSTYLCIKEVTPPCKFPEAHL